MKSTNWKDFAELVGIAAIVGSLVFVGLQMRQDQAIAVSELLASRSDALIELAALIESNNELWISGLNGDELPEIDRASFQAMAEAVESYFVAIYVRYEAMGRNSGGQEEPVINYAYALYLHDGLRRVWDEQIEYWQYRDSAFDHFRGDNPFRRRVSAELYRLDESAPQKPKTKRYVFW